MTESTSSVYSNGATEGMSGTANPEVPASTYQGSNESAGEPDETQEVTPGEEE